MKTTRKVLILACLMVATMLLLASCNLGDLFSGKGSDTTPTTTTNPPAEDPIDISNIPESQGLYYEKLDDTTCAVYGMGTCKDTVVRIPEVIDGYTVTQVAFMTNELWLGETVGQPTVRVTTLIIPKTVTNMSGVAYPGVASLVVDPENPIYYSEGNCVIEKISKTLVAGCDGSVIPQNVKGIRGSSFVYCSNLKSLSIPAGVTNIEPYFILACSKLTNVTVDSNNATYYAKGTCLIEKASETVLASWGDPVIVPKTVKNIPYPFYDFDEGIFGFLDEITFEGTKAEWGNVTFETSYLYFGQIFTVHCTDGDIVIEGTYVSGGDENCEHTFSSDCDSRCNNCDGYRNTTADHSYSSDCDARCDLCDDYRYIEDNRHTFSTDCDEYCDVCGEQRNPVVDHQFDERSMWPDFTCLDCGVELLIPIDECVYDCDSCGLGEIVRSCDKTFCEHCGAEYDAIHRYSSATDFDCYMCGHIRELEN